MPDAGQLLLGSLCTGYGGLDLACRDTLGTRTAWVAENDPHAAKVCRARFKAPNLGDIKTIDWTTIQPVDVLTAGYPCQPFSHAGKRRGADDPRHIWPYIAEGVRHLRPRLIVLENVAGHLTKGFGEVVGTLAAMGYDATWGCVRASDAGGCHQRKRVFILATDTTNQRREWEWVARGRGDGPADRGDAARCPECGAGWNSLIHQRHAHGWRTNAEVLADREAATDADGARLEGHGRPVERPRELTAAPRDPSDHAKVKLLPTPRAQNGEDRNQRPWVRPANQPQNLENALAHCLVDWGKYQQAITRWGTVIGRDAPPPTTDGRLSPALVEWMMGLPAGWVTSLDMARSHQLKILGNGVVPQQATLALHHLLPRL